MTPSARSRRCTTHNSTARRFRFQSSSHDVASHRHRRQRAEAHHLATGSRTILTVAMDGEVGEQEEEVHLARIGHHPWTGRPVTAHHRAECRQIGAIGDVVGVEAVVVDEEAMVGGRVPTADREAGRRDEACRALLTAGRRPGHLRDEEVEAVDTAGVTVLHGEVVAAVEGVVVGAGEAPATVRTAAIARGTAAGAGTAGEQLELANRMRSVSRDV
jgi:hypothetical protein